MKIIAQKKAEQEAKGDAGCGASHQAMGQEEKSPSTSPGRRSSPSKEARQKMIKRYNSVATTCSRE
eukprot:CAMPEP_0113951694 /NCGR_PEP_ID=MMETSP1339-20121228/87475_1 /TAXON_ID=94617 /ORGANISM="Fibrocapsa japonica" /LENGTH=65 /DNA_ID=CAMNT_0000960025 /DNA_START=12 /DNA_END=206 /DNA_ORIENTATION=+ /assembly_acc=CAM_ASM_000762